MSDAKTSSPRVQKLRASLEEKGAKRWELSPPPHPDDRQAIRDFAAKLARKRAGVAATRAKKRQDEAGRLRTVARLVLEATPEQMPLALDALRDALEP